MRLLTNNAIRDLELDAHTEGRLDECKLHLRRLIKNQEFSKKYLKARIKALMGEVISNDTR